MANVGTAIRSKLLEYSGVTAHVGQRIYPDVLKQNATMPAIVYKRISTLREHILKPDVTTAAHSRIEIRCYGTSRSNADDLADAVRMSGICAFQGSVGGVYIHATEIDSGDMYGEEAPTDGNQVHRYLTIFDFMVHYAEAR